MDQSQYFSAWYSIQVKDRNLGAPKSGVLIGLICPCFVFRQIAITMFYGNVIPWCVINWPFYFSASWKRFIRQKEISPDPWPQQQGTEHFMRWCQIIKINMHRIGFILSVNICICLMIELWHYNEYEQITQRSVCSNIYKLGVWYLWMIYFARKIIITVIDRLLTKSNIRTQRTMVTVVWVLAEI